MERVWTVVGSETPRSPLPLGLALARTQPVQSAEGIGHCDHESSDAAWVQRPLHLCVAARTPTLAPILTLALLSCRFLPILRQALDAATSSRTLAMLFALLI